MLCATLCVIYSLLFYCIVESVTETPTHVYRCGGVACGYVTNHNKKPQTTLITTGNLTMKIYFPVIDGEHRKFQWPHSYLVPPAVAGQFSPSIPVRQNGTFHMEWSVFEQAREWLQISSRNLLNVSVGYFPFFAYYDLGTCQDINGTKSYPAAENLVETILQGQPTENTTLHVIITNHRAAGCDNFAVNVPNNWIWLNGYDNANRGPVYFSRLVKAIGHAFGLAPSGVYTTEQDYEFYGDITDIMGQGEGYFNPPYRHYLGWLPDGTTPRVQSPTENIHEVFAGDDPAVVGNKTNKFDSLTVGLLMGKEANIGEPFEDPLVFDEVYFIWYREKRTTLASIAEGPTTNEPKLPIDRSHGATIHRVQYTDAKTLPGYWNPGELPRCRSFLMNAQYFNKKSGAPIKKDILSQQTGWLHVGATFQPQNAECGVTQTCVRTYNPTQEMHTPSSLQLSSVCRSALHVVSSLYPPQVMEDVWEQIYLFPGVQNPHEGDWVCFLDQDYVSYERMCTGCHQPNPTSNFRTTVFELPAPVQIPTGHHPNETQWACDLPMDMQWLPEESWGMCYARADADPNILSSWIPQVGPVVSITERVCTLTGNPVKRAQDYKCGFCQDTDGFNCDCGDSATCELNAGCGCQLTVVPALPSPPLPSSPPVIAHHNTHLYKTKSLEDHNAHKAGCACCNGHGYYHYSTNKSQPMCTCEPFASGPNCETVTPALTFIDPVRKIMFEPFGGVLYLSFTQTLDVSLNMWCEAHNITANELLFSNCPNKQVDVPQCNITVDKGYDYAVVAFSAWQEPGHKDNPGGEVTFVCNITNATTGIYSHPQAVLKATQKIFIREQQGAGQVTTFGLTKIDPSLSGDYVSIFASWLPPIHGNPLSITKYEFRTCETGTISCDIEKLPRSFGTMITHETTVKTGVAYTLSVRAISVIDGGVHKAVEWSDPIAVYFPPVQPYIRPPCLANTGCPDCGSYGNCNQTLEICECTHQRHGEACEISGCQQNRSTFECSGNGPCVNDNCVCDEFHFGQFCEFTIWCGDPQCGHKGNCYPGGCVCTNKNEPHDANCHMPSPPAIPAIPSPETPSGPPSTKPDGPKRFAEIGLPIILTLVMLIVSVAAIYRYRGKLSKWLTVSSFNGLSLRRPPHSSHGTQDVSSEMKNVNYAPVKNDSFASMSTLWQPGANGSGHMDDGPSPPGSPTRGQNFVSNLSFGTTASSHLMAPQPHRGTSSQGNSRAAANSWSKVMRWWRQSSNQPTGATALSPEEAPLTDKGSNTSTFAPTRGNNNSLNLYTGTDSFNASGSFYGAADPVSPTVSAAQQNLSFGGNNSLDSASPKPKRKPKKAHDIAAGLTITPPQN